MSNSFLVIGFRPLLEDGFYLDPGSTLKGEAMRFFTKSVTRSLTVSRRRLEFECEVSRPKQIELLTFRFLFVGPF